MAFDPNELAFIRPLRGLPREHILSFLDACQSADLPADEVIVVEGEEDDSMVFILEGTLEVYVGKAPEITVLQQLRRGESVGELSLLGLSQRRTASVRTVEPCGLLVLDRSAFEKLRAAGHPVVDRIEDGVLHTLAERIRDTDLRIGQLAEGTQLEQTEPEGLWARLSTSLTGPGPSGRPPPAVELLKKSAHFSSLEPNLMARLGKALEPVGVARGERVLEEGSMKGDAWIIGTGKIGVYRATRSELHEKVGTLGPGTLFGHLSIIDNHMRTATCVAEEASWLYRLPRNLARAVIENEQAEARALRQCFIHALAQQLQSANSRLDHVSRASAQRLAARRLEEGEIQEVNRARMAVISAD